MQRLKDLLTTTTALLALAGVAGLAGTASAGGPGVIRFDDRSFEVIEEAGVAVISVERSGGEDGVVTVDYHTAAGTAVEGADYGPVAGTLTWADGDGSDRVFTLPIFDDAEAEGDEIIQLVLSNPTGGAVLDGLRSVSVLVVMANDGGDAQDGEDSDAESDDSDDESDTEDSDGEDSDSADSDGESDSADSDSVDSDSADSDSADSDGEDSDSEDSDSEDSDSESDSADSDSADSDGEDSDAENPAGLIKFDEESFEVLEDAGVAIVFVERSGGEDGEVSVSYSTSDGSATEGDDYTGVAGTLTWFAGDGIDKTFIVPIIDDADAEGTETIELTLHDPVGGAGLHPTRSTSVVRILANDGGTGGGDGGDDGGDDGSAGTLKFSSSTFQVIEGSGVATITVERSRGETGAVSVDVMTFDGSAVDGLDYTGVAGTLTWGHGDGGNKTLMVPITDDDEAEGNETIELLLANPTGGAVLDAQRGEAVLTVVDDDSGACQPGAGTMCLLGGRFKVQVTWQTRQATSGRGRPVTLSDQSGLVWFFDPANVEILVKVLDGCSFSNTFWVFFAPTTDLGLEVTVTDTATGQSKTYRNPVGRTAQPVQDVTTFTGCN